MSGDLDIVAPNDELLTEALLSAGFLLDERIGRLGGGFYHPRYSEYGSKLSPASCSMAGRPVTG